MFKLLFITLSTVAVCTKCHFPESRSVLLINSVDSWAFATAVRRFINIVSLWCIYCVQKNFKVRDRGKSTFSATQRFSTCHILWLFIAKVSRISNMYALHPIKKISISEKFVQSVNSFHRLHRALVYACVVYVCMCVSICIWVLDRGQNRT